MKEDHKKDQTLRPQANAYSSHDGSASLSPPNLMTSMTEETNQSNNVGQTLTPTKKTTKEL